MRSLLPALLLVGSLAHAQSSPEYWKSRVEFGNQMVQHLNDADTLEYLTRRAEQARRASKPVVARSCRSIIFTSEQARSVSDALSVRFQDDGGGKVQLAIKVPGTESPDADTIFSRVTLRAGGKVREDLAGQTFSTCTSCLIYAATRPDGSMRTFFATSGRVADVAAKGNLSTSGVASSRFENVTLVEWDTRRDRPIPNGACLTMSRLTLATTWRR